MEITLSPVEARIIGCMLEKEVTTPDQYPLSLNSLTNACNQKSNREPVMSLSELEVQNALDELVAKRLVTSDEGFSGRVNKYQHRFCNTEFGSLKFTEQEKAIICITLLRGPQTPGEIRTRSNRLAEFSNVQQVEDALSNLITNEHVVKLEREPGKRESRFANLFTNGDYEAASNEQINSGAPSENNSEVAQLRAEIATLRSELAEIKDHLGL